MKPKFSFRFFLMALATAFSAIGCQPKPTDNPPLPISFNLQIKNVAAGEVTLAAQPNDNSATYFFGAITKTEFDAFASQSAFFDAELVRLKALATAQQMTLSAYVAANAKQGVKDVKLATSVPLAPYFAYVYTLDATGKATSNLFKIAFTSGEAPKTAPELELTFVAGDADGYDKDIKMTIGGKSLGVTSGKLLLVAKSDLDAALAQGATIETIIKSDQKGSPFEEAEIAALNGEGGWKYTYLNLVPATAYSTIVMVTNAVGSTIKRIDESTLADAGSAAPTLNLTLVRGDKNGNNKSTCLTAKIKSNGAAIGRYGLFSKSAVDAQLEAGKSLTTLIENNGYAFTDEQLAAINSVDGYTIDIVELDPNKSYTFIAKVGAIGGRSVDSKSATTTTGIGPDLTVAMVPGDKDGANTDVNLSVTLKSAGVLSGRYTLMTKAVFDAEIAKGTTPAQILTANSATFSPADLTAINTSAGLTGTFSALTSSTAYKYIVEADSENGRSYQYADALTTDSSAPTSAMTFEFKIDDLSSTAATIVVTPSNNTDTYYFDFLPVAEYDKMTDDQMIAKLIGSAGISSGYLVTGVNGYDYASFDYMPLTASTSYYIYAFGYDEATKSATTKMVKQKFTTPAADEPSTAAYSAWLGTWTVVSTSSEKDGAPISMELEITKKANNVSYYVSGWGVTSYRYRKITASLKTDGALSIKNKQDIDATSTGRLYFVGRYYNEATVKYAMVIDPIDALIGTLGDGGQSATFSGGTFSLEGQAEVQTITGMDFYNNKDADGKWYAYTSLTEYKTSGNGVGPFALTKVAAASGVRSAGGAVQSTGYKVHLAKRALLTRALAGNAAGGAFVLPKAAKASGVEANKVSSLTALGGSAARFSLSKID